MCTYLEIQDEVYRWVVKNAENFIKNDDEIVCTSHTEDELIVDFTFTHCLGQLIVVDPYFAPYRYVYYEAMTMDSNISVELDSPEVIYCFFDTPIFSKGDVLRGLEKAVKYSANYLPNYLYETYYNKIGKINLCNEDIHMVVHPNYIDKIIKMDLSSVYKCIGVEAQYLILESAEASLKIEASCFEILDV